MNHQDNRPPATRLAPPLPVGRVAVVKHHTVELSWVWKAAMDRLQQTTSSKASRIRCGRRKFGGVGIVASVNKSRAHVIELA